MLFVVCLCFSIVSIVVLSNPFKAFKVFLFDESSTQVFFFSRFQFHWSEEVFSKIFCWANNIHSESLRKCQIVFNHFCLSVYNSLSESVESWEVKSYVFVLIWFKTQMDSDHFVTHWNDTLHCATDSKRRKHNEDAQTLWWRITVNHSAERILIIVGKE